MRLSALGEFGLIRTIEKLTSQKTPGMLLGIGDDAAALAISPNTILLATTDMLIEHVHFDLTFTDFQSLGWKSAAVNVSDIAAMGGKPRFCLTSLGIPSRITVEQIADFYRGLHAVLKKHNIALVGGDTCSSREDFTISVTLLGEVEKKKMVTRSGARPGDKIFVTNSLGDSAAGLELLQSRNAPDKIIRGQAPCGMRNIKSAIRNPRSEIKKLIERHLRPDPRVTWGGKLASAGCVSSMIDLSDGLSSDLSHICKQSKTGAIIHAESIPFSKALLASAHLLRKPLLHYALSGGEDYELLLTVPQTKIKNFLRLGIPATEIGEITRSRGLFLVDENNKKKKMMPNGYNHFSGSVS